MKKYILTLSIITIIVFTLSFERNLVTKIPNNGSSELKKNKDNYVQKVTSNKVFEIGFDKGINEMILNSKNVYVLDRNNNIVSTTTKKVDEQLINILPPKNGYETGETYHLYINKKLDLEKAKNDKHEFYQINFEIAKSS